MNRLIKLKFYFAKYFYVLFKPSMFKGNSLHAVKTSFCLYVLPNIGYANRNLHTWWAKQVHRNFNLFIASLQVLTKHLPVVQSLLIKFVNVTHGKPLHTRENLIKLLLKNKVNDDKKIKYRTNKVTYLNIYLHAV